MGYIKSGTNVFAIALHKLNGRFLAYLNMSNSSGTSLWMGLVISPFTVLSLQFLAFLSLPTNTSMTVPIGHSLHLSMSFEMCEYYILATF